MSNAIDYCVRENSHRFTQRIEVTDPRLIRSISKRYGKNIDFYILLFEDHLPVLKYDYCIEFPVRQWKIETTKKE